MSRSFSMAGHSPRFKDLSTKLELKVCGELSFKEYFYDDGYSLKIYADKNGNKYEEFEQACPWAGGPILYLGLKNQTDKKTVCAWTVLEINEDLGMECYSEEDVQGADNE